MADIGIRLSLYQKSEIRIFQDQVVNQQILLLINGVSPEDLKEILEDSLEDLRSSKKIFHGRNYFNIRDFGERFPSKQRSLDYFLENPQYEIDMQNKEIKNLWDYSIIDEVLKKYKKDGKRDPREIFTLKLKKEIAWIQEKQEKMIAYLLEKQREAIEQKDPTKLVKITYNDLGNLLGYHPTTAARILRNTGIKINGQSLLAEDLMTSNPDEFIAKELLLSYSRLYKTAERARKEKSDRVIQEELASQGINIARRTINKYRIDLENGCLKYGAREEEQEKQQHWYFDRELKDEDIEDIVKGRLTQTDIQSLSRRNKSWGKGLLKKYKGKLCLYNLNSIPTLPLIYFLTNRKKDLSESVYNSIYNEINSRNIGFSSEELERMK